MLKTLGSGRSDQEIESLCQRVQQELEKTGGSISLFVNPDDTKIESFIGDLSIDQVQVIGPELTFGKIYLAIGFNQIENDLYCHLVITRLFHPGRSLAGSFIFDIRIILLICKGFVIIKYKQQK